MVVEAVRTGVVSLLELRYSKSECLKRLEEFTRKVRALGSDCRRAKNEENGLIDWDKVFRSSLLGARLGYHIDYSCLIENERRLLPNVMDRNKVKLIILCDVDNVLVNPAESSGQMDSQIKAGLREVGEAADGFITRSSRFFLPEEQSWPNRILRFVLSPLQKGELGLFPICDSSTQSAFARIAPDKVVFQSNKPLVGGDRFLSELSELLLSTGEIAKVMIYSFISSKKDEDQACQCLKKWPDIAPYVAFISTANGVL